MKKYKYTNKNEIPVPRYHKVQHVWFIQNDMNNGGYPTETEIRDAITRWVDYGESPPPSCYTEEEKKEWVEERKPHWEIRYRHKPCLFAKRTVQHQLDEDKCYPSEEEAEKASLISFQDSVKRIIGIHKKRFEKLGLDFKTFNLLENQDKK